MSMRPFQGQGFRLGGDDAQGRASRLVGDDAIGPELRPSVYVTPVAAADRDRLDPPVAAADRDRKITDGYERGGRWGAALRNALLH